MVRIVTTSTLRRSAHRAVTGRAQRLALLATAASTLLGAALASTTPVTAFANEPQVSAEWLGETQGRVVLTPSGESAVLGRIRLSGDVASDLVYAEASGGRFDTIPEGCLPSDAKRRNSTIGGTHDEVLRCRIPASATNGWTTPFEVVPTPGANKTPLDVTVSTSTDRARMEQIPASPQNTHGTALLHLLSSPDFLNADIGDLADGPNRWRPGKTPNSINAVWQRSLDTVLDDWASREADGMLVAGDLVDGHWGEDPTRSGVFGPVDNDTRRRHALRSAASTFYPQWLQRFTSRGIDVYPAMGDHDLGDNPWDGQRNRNKFELQRDFETAFVKGVLKPIAGAWYTNRPSSGIHRQTAYAWRPTPEVQILTLNVFDYSDGRHMRVRLDRAQMRWAEKVLAKAKADGVQWIVAQGHTPIIGPVRVENSSGMRYGYGANSTLWKAFKKYGVDLYLSGEVHATTVTEKDGIVQVSHGGAFQHGSATYLDMRFYDDRLDLDLRDFDATISHGNDLFSVQRGGYAGYVDYSPGSYSIGTGTITGSGVFAARSGIVREWDGRSAIYDPR